MFSSINKLFGQKPAPKGAPLMPEPSSRSPLQQSARQHNQQTYSKVFRWRLPDGQTQAPESVAIVGSFTHWQKIQMQRDSTTDAWHTTVHHIPGNKTHHYMILVDDQPVHDRNSDGLAVPAGPQEERFQLMTDRGPRVFMLFAQAK
jgi:1,4-alpha-glucan branching enzyme